MDRFATHRPAVSNAKWLEVPGVSRILPAHALVQETPTAP